jgi:hypothetical protein
MSRADSQFGMAKAIFSPSPALLTNTDVLIANEAQFYNPSTAAWVNTGALPKTAENPVRATLLNTGNVLASGTVCDYSGCGHVPTATCFLYKLPPIHGPSPAAWIRPASATLRPCFPVARWWLPGVIPVASARVLQF